MSAQQALDFTPPPQPIIPVQDQRVPKLEVKRLGRMSQAILDRLRQGPATNAELAQLFPAGAAWRSRLSDCRLWLQKHGETIQTENLGGGLYRYWLASC